MSNIKLGVLGLGRMGLIHCGSIKSTPGLVLAAGSSRVDALTRAARERFNIQVYKSHDELLNDPEINWVVIATTTEKHKKWALKAIAAGKELIIEKPVALSFADAEEIFYKVFMIVKKKLRTYVAKNEYSYKLWINSIIKGEIYN